MPDEFRIRHAECRFTGETAQVAAVRRFVAALLGDEWPGADEAVLLTSELAANAVLHSSSGRPGGKFTVRVIIRPGDYFWVVVEDEGGQWIMRAADSDRPHGLDIVAAVADEWGREGDAVGGWLVWARMDCPRVDNPRSASGKRAGPRADPRASDHSLAGERDQRPGVPARDWYRQLQALDDAIAYRQARVTAPCPDCVSAAGRRFDDHACDVDLIAGYRRRAQATIADLARLDASMPR